MTGWAGFWIALVLFLAGYSAFVRFDCVAVKSAGACAQIEQNYTPKPTT